MTTDPKPEPVTPTPAEPRERVDHADMRIEIVKRELNQGALAGFDSEVTAYAAQLVVAALDSYDAAALKAEYERGVQHGKVVQTIFGNSVENLQAEYERGIAEGLRQATEGRELEDTAWHRLWLMRDWDNLAAALSPEQEQVAGAAVERVLKRIHGPGEPAEQPEPAGGAS